MEGLSVYNEPCRSLDLEQHFCSLVGDLSEGVLSCSFNDDEVLELALKGVLNEQIQHVCSYERERCMGLIGHYNPPDGDYQAEFMRLLEALRGWPEGWYAPFTPLWELEDRYKKLFIGTEHEYLLTPPVEDTIHLTAYRIVFPTIPDSLVSGQSVCCDLSDEPYRFRPDGKGYKAFKFEADIDNVECEIIVTYMGGEHDTTVSTCVVKHRETKAEYHGRLFPQISKTTPIGV